MFVFEKQKTVLFFYRANYPPLQEICKSFLQKFLFRKILFQKTHRTKNLTAAQRQSQAAKKADIIRPPNARTDAEGNQSRTRLLINPLSHS